MDVEIWPTSMVFPRATAATADRRWDRLCRRRRIAHLAYPMRALRPAGTRVGGDVAFHTGGDHQSLSLSADHPGQVTLRRRAGDALGVAKIKTLQFTGSGANFSVGQNFTPNEPWPRVTVKSYTASINYDTGSMRQELLREMGTVMPRGGGAPFTGEQRQIQVVSGNYAWNVRRPPGAAAPPAPRPRRAAPSSACSRCGRRRRAS